MKYIKIIYSIFILNLLVSCSLFEEQQIVEVKGKVVRELTGIGEPNVEIQVTSRYTYGGGFLSHRDTLMTKNIKTNDNGDFSIKMPYKYSGEKNAFVFYRTADQNGDNYDKMYYSFNFESEEWSFGNFCKPISSLRNRS